MGGAATLMVMPQLSRRMSFAESHVWLASSRFIPTNDTAIEILRPRLAFARISAKANILSGRQSLDQLCHCAFLVAHGGDRRLQHAECFVHLLIGDHQRD